MTAGTWLQSAQVSVPGLPPRLAEEVPDVDTKSVGDSHQPPDARVGGAGLDALDGEALDARPVTETFLGEVRVHPGGPYSFPELSALVKDPFRIRLGFAWHSTNAGRLPIMSQHVPACF